MKKELISILKRWPFELELEWLKCHIDDVSCPCLLATTCLYELEVLTNVYSRIFDEDEVEHFCNPKNIREAKRGLYVLCQDMKTSVEDYILGIGLI